MAKIVYRKGNLTDKYRKGYGIARHIRIAQEQELLKDPSRFLLNQTLTRETLLRSICRDSYFQFVKTFWHTIVPEKPHWNWHIEFECNEIQKRLERIFAGQPKEDDLVYNQPPGTSKSLVFSVMLLPWAWTRMPTFRMIGASHTLQPLALNLSRLSRAVIKSELYRKLFPEICLSEDQDTKTNYANTHGGQRYAVGSNGSVLGMHAHCIVIDDPIDPQQALSEVELERVNNWITGELLTRKVSSSISVVFMVMQRLHQDDPSARMAQRPRVTQYVLPATLDYPVKPKHLEQFYSDSLFDPTRLPAHVLDEKRAELGDYQYAGQYGQDPVPLGGGKFKIEKLRKGIPPQEFRKQVVFWDKAISTNKRAAYTCGVHLAEDYDNVIWILNVWRERLDSFSREKLIRQVANKLGHSVIYGIEQEPGSGGKESAERTATQTLRGYRVTIIKPTGDKQTRADPFSIVWNQGFCATNISLWDREKPLNWLQIYIDEFRHWPYSKFKDQVDATSGAYTIISQTKRRIGALKPSEKYREKISQEQERY